MSIKISQVKGRNVFAHIGFNAMFFFCIRLNFKFLQNSFNHEYDVNYNLNNNEV